MLASPKSPKKRYVQSYFLGDLKMQSIDFFRHPISTMIHLDDPLAVLATPIGSP